jgi:hypothetical protein
MTERQEQQLFQIYGTPQIRQLDSTVKDAAEILAIPADVYAVVLPLDILASLRSRTDREIIQPVSGRVPTGNMTVNPATGTEEPEYAFDHLYWQKILRLELETEIMKV